jgi:hypothetical protein
LKDVEPAPFSPGDKSATVAQNTTIPATNNQPATTTTTAPAENTTASATQAVNQPAKAQTQEELPTFVPAPKSLVSDRSAAEVAAVNRGNNIAPTGAVLTSLPHPVDASVGRMRTATLSLPNEITLGIGEKQQFAIEFDSQVPLGLAVVTLRFDPKVVKVKTIAAGSLFASNKAARITQSIDPSGVCLISISTLNGAAPMNGNGSLVIIEVEGIGAGDASILFDQDNMHLVATDARDVKLDVKQGRVTVKQ